MTLQRVRSSAHSAPTMGAPGVGEPRLHHSSHCSRLLAPLSPWPDPSLTDGPADRPLASGLASLREMQAGA